MIEIKTQKTIHQYRVEDLKPKLLSELDNLIDKLIAFKNQINKLDAKNPNIAIQNNMILWFTPVFLIWEQLHTTIEILNTLNKTTNNQ